jgi:hypothetical protein
MVDALRWGAPHAASIDAKTEPRTIDQRALWGIFNA